MPGDKKNFFPHHMLMTPKATAIVGLTVTTFIPIALGYASEFLTEMFGEQVGAAVRYIRKRVPNLHETVVNTVPKSIIEFLAQDHLHGLGKDNPTTSGFIRDFLKFPGVCVNYYYEVPIGKTHYVYDFYHVLSQGLKPVCKVGTIFAIAGRDTSFDPDAYAVTLDSASRLSNYACEVPSRILTELSQLQQDQHATNIPWYKFAYDNIGFVMVLDAIFTAILKTAVSDSLSLYIKESGLSAAWRGKVNSFENLYFNLGENIGKDPSVWTKMTSMTGDNIERSILFTVEILSKVGHDMLMSYLLSGPARGAGDLFPEHLFPSTEEFKEFVCEKTGYLCGETPAQETEL